LIQVTERARQALKDVQADIVSRPDVALRLAPTEQGQLSVFPDTVRTDDQVVEHDGQAVLFIQPDVAKTLAGSTVDFEDTVDGARFTLSR